MRSIAPDYDDNDDIDDDCPSSSYGGHTPQEGVGNTTGEPSSGPEQGLNHLHETTREAVSTSSSRLFTLELSPCHHKSSCRYDITNDGVFGQS